MEKLRLTGSQRVDGNVGEERAWRVPGRGRSMCNWTESPEERTWVPVIITHGDSAADTTVKYSGVWDVCGRQKWYQTVRRIM